MNLSIVMPVYNVEKYIEKSINTIIQQNDNKMEFELILVNDGTTDASIDIAEKLLGNSNLKYQIIHQKNSGVSAARNTGIAHAEGKYIYFLDSDDYISNDFMNRLSMEIAKDYDIIFWAYNDVDLSNRILQSYTDKFSDRDKFYINGITAMKDILIERKQWIWTGSAIYLKRLLTNHNLLFNSKHINGEDQEFILSTLIYAEKVNYIADILSFYLIRDNSISTSFKLKKFDSVLALENVRERLQSSQKANKLLTEAINCYIVENFLYVYKSGLKVKTAEYMVTKTKSLDDLYPMFNDKMKKRIREYKSKSLLKKLEIIIAKRSMLVYGIIYKLFLRLKR